MEGGINLYTGDVFDPRALFTEQEQEEFETRYGDEEFFQEEEDKAVGIGSNCDATAARGDSRLGSSRSLRKLASASVAPRFSVAHTYARRGGRT